MLSMKCFKAYDIRGRIPDELNDEIAWRIGRAFAAFVNPGKVVVGHDIRLSSPSMCLALAQGLMDGGSDVYHIGQCGTEEIYFATSHFEMDGGIVVTASHNPRDYNGMKLVRENSKPISGDTGLNDIGQMVETNKFDQSPHKGRLEALDHRSAYCDKLLSYVDLGELSPLKIVVNASNGGAGEIIDRLEGSLPFEFIKVQHEPDGNFPNGVPNPLLVENRAPTIEAIAQHGADLGIAWDGDFDRCFFFDETGRFIEGYYIVGLLAETFLARSAPEKIVHDPRLTWNTIDLVKHYGGEPILSKTGHAFIKERMRKENAVYGGEMSAHHYFRDFAYCDSGMIPWLLVAAILSQSGRPLSELVVEMQAAFPISGEINSRVDDQDGAISKVEEFYRDIQARRDYTDGFSLEATDFRFNIRKSNTEPVLRLNVETRANPRLLEEKTAELLGLIRG